MAKQTFSKSAYQLVFVICWRLALWAAKKGDIKIPQHEIADQGSQTIEDAGTDADMPEPDYENNPDDDAFNNDDWNG